MTGADFQTLEAIVRHTGPAIESGTQRAGSERLAADVDALTGLGNRTSLPRDARARGRPGTPARPQAGRLRAWTSTTSGRSTPASARSPATASSSRSPTLLRETIRPADLAYRSGGDEFTVILPDAGPDRGRGALRAAPGDAATVAGLPHPRRQPLGRHRRAEAGRRRRLALRARRAGAAAGEGGGEGDSGVADTVEGRRGSSPSDAGTTPSPFFLGAHASARAPSAPSFLRRLRRSVLDGKLLVERRGRGRSGRCRRRRSPRALPGAPAPRPRTSRTAAARPARS